MSVEWVRTSTRSPGVSLFGTYGSTGALLVRCLNVLRSPGVFGETTPAEGTHTHDWGLTVPGSRDTGPKVLESTRGRFRVGIATLGPQVEKTQAG